MSSEIGRRVDGKSSHAGKKQLSGARGWRHITSHKGRQAAKNT